MTGIRYIPKLNLIKIDGYVAEERGTTVIRRIVEKPNNPIDAVLRYADFLRERYGKNVKTEFVKSVNFDGIRFKREDGIWFYVDREGNVYVSKKDLKHPKIHVFIRYFLYGCGYKVKNAERGDKAFLKPCMRIF